MKKKMPLPAKKETSLPYGARRTEILEWRAKGKTKKEVIELMHGRCSPMRVEQVWAEGEVKPEPPISPLDLPALDPTKPLPPQYEALGAAILTEAARKGEISSRQIQAARELIRMAQRDRVPPPVSRKLRLVIETIDVIDDKIHVVERQPIEVRL